MELLTDLFARLSDLATRGPLAVPIWAALFLLSLSFLRGPMLRLIFKLAKITDPLLQERVKRQIDTPLQALFILLAVLPFTFLLMKPLGAFVAVGLHAAILFLLFYIVVQTIDLSVFSWYLVRKQTNVSGVVRFFVLFVLYGIAALLTLDWAFGVSVLPLLATSTVVSAVIGLSLQDTLKNAFAGLNMSMEKSFVQGDWVSFRLDSTEQWFGQIVEIGWRTTKIRTLNNNYAIIPNAKFTNHELINFSKPDPVHARTIELPVSHKADPESVRIALIASALSVEGVLADPEPNAHPLEIKTDHVRYQLRFWMTELDMRERLTGEVLERSWKELKELGALPSVVKSAE